MDSKLLYQVGNFFTGYPWGVEVVRQFGTTELHGPFNSENAANTYMHALVTDGETPQDGPYVSLKVCKIETPQVGRHIAYTGKGEHGGYEYA